MPPIRQIQKKYGTRALTTAVLMALVLVLAGQKPVAKGLILGTLFSILNFVILGEMIPQQVGKAGRRLYAALAGSITLRFGLMAVPLVLAVKTAWLNFAAVAAGLFMVQLMILAEQLSARMPLPRLGKKSR